ncbi:MAG: hypothetical protein AAGA46_11830 [Cyanobacteria bacterium P01_F01_bin.13]
MISAVQAGIEPQKLAEEPAALLAELPDLLDRQQQVNAAGNLVGTYRISYNRSSSTSIF